MANLIKFNIMKSNLFLLIIPTIFILSCKKDNHEEVLPLSINADFTAIDTLYSQEEWIEFENTGDSVAKCYWDFGDGNTSTQRNPRHFYYHPGIYKVKLKIVDKYENNDSIIKQIRIGEWFAYQIKLIDLEEYKYYNKDEYWDEDSTGIHALPDIFFEIKDTTGQVFYTSETYYNLQPDKLPITFLIPDIRIEPYFIGWTANNGEPSIFINLNEDDGDKIENIMTSYDTGIITSEYDRLNHIGEFTISAGASFKVLYKVK